MIQWVGETLFATTVLMLLILAIRPFVADRFLSLIHIFPARTAWQPKS